MFCFDEKTQFLWKKFVLHKCLHNILTIPWGWLFLDAIWRICSRYVCIITRLHLRNGDTKKTLCVWRFHDDSFDVCNLLFHFPAICVWLYFVSAFGKFKYDRFHVCFYFNAESHGNFPYLCMIFQGNKYFFRVQIFVSVFQTKTKRKLLCDLTRNLLLHPKCNAMKWEG